MEALWDSLIQEDVEIPSPDWHGEVLEERLRKLETGESQLLTLEEVRAKYRT